MKLKEKISLEKVFEKEYKVKLVELESNKEAVITHFLHNSKNGVSQFFKKVLWIFFIVFKEFMNKLARA